MTSSLRSTSREQLATVNSLLSIVPTEELAVHCAAFEKMARRYWECCWQPETLFTPEHHFWYMQHAAIFYAEARRVRAEAVRRTSHSTRSASVP